MNGSRRDRVKKATVGKEAWKSVTMEVIQRGDGGVGGDGRGQRQDGRDRGGFVNQRTSGVELDYDSLNVRSMVEKNYFKNLKI